MPGNSTKKCPKPGHLYVEVRRPKKDNTAKWDKLEQKCALNLSGGEVAKPDDSVRDNTTYKNLCAGGYTLRITPQGDESMFEISEEVQQKKVILFPNSKVGFGPLSRPVTIESDKTRMHYYRLHPYV